MFFEIFYWFASVWMIENMFASGTRDYLWLDLLNGTAIGIHEFELRLKQANACTRQILNCWQDLGYIVKTGNLRKGPKCQALNERMSFGRYEIHDGQANGRDLGITPEVAMDPFRCRSFIHVFADQLSLLMTIAKSSSSPQPSMIA